jgi:hypothetical protein
MAVAGHDALDQQDDGADRDGRVRDVEGREEPAFVMDAYEIHHVAVDHAVDDVADGPAQDERQ